MWASDGMTEFSRVTEEDREVDLVDGRSLTASLLPSFN